VGKSSWRKDGRSEASQDTAAWDMSPASIGSSSAIDSRVANVLLSIAGPNDLRRAKKEEQDVLSNVSLRSSRIPKTSLAVGRGLGLPRNLLYPLWNREQQLPILPGEKEPCGRPKSDTEQWLVDFCRRRSMSTTEDHTKDEFLFTTSVDVSDIPDWIEGYELRFDIADMSHEEADELYRHLYELYLQGNPAILLAKQPRCYPLFFDINIRGHANVTEVDDTLDSLNFDNLCFFGHLARALQEIYLQPFTMAVFQNHGVCVPTVPQFTGESYAKISFHVVFPELIVLRGSNCVEKRHTSDDNRQTRIRELDDPPPVNHHMLILDHVRHYFTHACEDGHDPALLSFWEKITAMDNNNVWTEIIGEDTVWHEPWDDLTGVRLAFTKKCNELREPREKVPWKAFCVTKEATSLHQPVPRSQTGRETTGTGVNGVGGAGGGLTQSTTTPGRKGSFQNTLHTTYLKSQPLAVGGLGRGGSGLQLTRSPNNTQDLILGGGGANSHVPADGVPYQTMLQVHDDLSPDSILWSRWGNVADPRGHKFRSETVYESSKLRRYQSPLGENACFCLFCEESDKYKKYSRTLGSSHQALTGQENTVATRDLWEEGWKKYRDPVSEEVFYWRSKRYMVLQELKKHPKHALSRSTSSPDRLSAYFDSPTHVIGESAHVDFMDSSAEGDDKDDESSYDSSYDEEDEYEYDEEDEDDNSTVGGWKRKFKVHHLPKHLIHKILRRPSKGEGKQEKVVKQQELNDKFSPANRLDRELPGALANRFKAISVVGKLGKGLEKKLKRDKTSQDKKKAPLEHGRLQGLNLSSLDKRTHGGERPWQGMDTISEATSRGHHTIVSSQGPATHASGIQGEGFWFHAPGSWVRQMDPRYGYFYWHIPNERYFWDS